MCKKQTKKVDMILKKYSNNNQEKEKKRDNCKAGGNTSKIRWSNIAMRNKLQLFLAEQAKDPSTYWVKSFTNFYFYFFIISYIYFPHFPHFPHFILFYFQLKWIITVMMVH